MNSTRRTGPNALVPFLEIVAESGGSVSCDTQLNCRTFFTIATALHPFSAFCLVVLPSSAGTSTLRRTYTPIARRSIEFLRLASASGISFSRHSSTLCFLKIVARVVRLLVSALHDRYSGAGNCSGLLSNTALFLSTSNKYLLLFEHHFIPCDS